MQVGVWLRRDRTRRVRAAILLLALACAAIFYLVLLAAFDAGSAPVDRHFGVAPRDPGALHIYAEILAVDPVQESMRVRVEVMPGEALRGSHATTVNRTMAVELTEGETVHDALLRAGTSLQPILAEFELTGRVAAFPLDRYRARLSVAAYPEENGVPDRAHPIPVGLTVWEGLPAWQISAAQVPDVAAPAIALDVGLRRAGALAMFALCVYAIMVVLAASALTIGSLVFLRVRRVEATLTGMLAACIFALPTLRNTLPGAPPLGVRADLLVFLWAEIAVAIGLLLFVSTWVRDGPRP